MRVPSLLWRAGLSVILATVAACGGGGGGGGDEELAPRQSLVETGFDEAKLYDWSDVSGGGDGGGGDGGGDGGGGAGGAGSFGAIRYATVNLYDNTGKLIGTGTSDEKGLVTLRSGGHAPPLLVEFAGNDKAEYFDEGRSMAAGSESAAWRPFPAHETLSVYWTDYKQHVVASPLTNAAVAQIRANGILPVTVAAVHAANDNVRNTANALFSAAGISVSDITKVPTLAYNVAALEQLGGDERGQYRQMLAALSKSAAQFDPSLTSPGLEIAKHLATDLTDGVIDGKDKAGNALPATAYTPATLTETVTAQAAGTLTIVTSGNGTVQIPSGVPEVPCQPANASVRCYYPWIWGSRTTLTAQPASGSLFNGWSGACSGEGECVLAMNGDRTVTAIFAAQPGTLLSVAKAGAGDGMVTSSPDGISCGTSCSAVFASGTVVLMAAPDASSTFGGWSGGGCSGTLPSCTVSLDASKSVTATFNGPQAQVALNVAVAGEGSVKSSPTGIDCGTQCGTTFAANTQVTLTATPVTGATFVGWDGACSGAANTCTVALDTARNVTATFAGGSGGHTLTVSTTGDGLGVVTSSPAGISCGAQCSASFPAGTAVVLTATPDTASVFMNWDGACSGASPTCTVTLDAAKSAFASFRAGVQLSGTIDGLEDSGHLVERWTGERQPLSWLVTSFVFPGLFAVGAPVHIEYNSANSNPYANPNMQYCKIDSAYSTAFVMPSGGRHVQLLCTYTYTVETSIMGNPDGLILRYAGNSGFAWRSSIIPGGEINWGMGIPLDQTGIVVSIETQPTSSHCSFWEGDEDLGTVVTIPGATVKNQIVRTPPILCDS